MQPILIILLKKIQQKEVYLKIKMKLKILLFKLNF